MILTRFCSRAEYDRYLAGETLTNDTDHYRSGLCASTSVGFCFTLDPPETAWRYLKGIVDWDVCMVLDIDRSLLTESKGRYVDYAKGFGHSCIKTEYCLRSYSRDTARQVKALQPEEFATEAEIEALMILREWKQGQVT